MKCYPAFNTGRKFVLARAVIQTLEDRRLLAGVSFNPFMSHSTGGDSNGIVVADFNGDGAKDAIVSNQNGQAMSLFFGDGAGGFGAANQFGGVLNPYGIKAADLDGDGDLDLVINRYFDDKISVLLNNGSASFGSPLDFGVGASPTALALGDVNGDNIIDAVTSSSPDSGGGQVSVFLGVNSGNGKGTGGFGVRTDFPTVTSPYGVALGDLNGDNKLDIAAAGTNAISVLLGNGDGTFGAKADSTIGDFLREVAIGDVTGDGKADVVAAVYSGTNGHPRVAVLPGKGNGTFAARRFTVVSAFPSHLEIADVSGDGSPDIITNGQSSQTVCVLQNKGNGAFLVKKEFSTDTGPNDLAVTDINGDNKPDIITANTTSNNFTTGAMDVLLNTTSSGTGGTPLVVPSIGKLGFYNISVPLDTGTVQIKLTNQGTARAVGRVKIDLYASTDQVVDNSDIHLLTPKFSSVPVLIGANKTQSAVAKLTVPSDAQPGSYYLLAVVTPLTGLTADQVSSTPVATSTPGQIVHSFGAVGLRKNVKFTRTDTDGSTIVYRLTGGGTGTWSEDEDGLVSLNLTGTTTKSKLLIGVTKGNKETNIQNITTDAPLGSIVAPKVVIGGNVSINGDLNSMTVLSVGADTGTQRILSFGGADPITLLNLGIVTDASITTNAVIKTLKVAHWLDGNGTRDLIGASSIKLLTSQGAFAPDMHLSHFDTGPKTINSFSAKGDVTGKWTIIGNVGSVSSTGSFPTTFALNVILGSLGSLSAKGSFDGLLATSASITTFIVKGTMNGALVQAGANFGADGLPGGGDDTYNFASIKSISVGGAVTSTFFFAGIDALQNPLTGSSIKAAVFKSTLDFNSLVLSEKLPKKVRVDGKLVDTATDPRFSPDGL